VLSPSIIQFRHTTPGSVASLLSRDPPWSRDLAVDPTHPAVATYLSKRAPSLPALRNEFISLRAFPKALLQKPEYQWPNPPYPPAEIVCWEERVVNEKRNNPKKSQNATTSVMDMSLLLVLGKKALHNKATIRRRVSKKLKVAISLIVTRGADVEVIPSSETAKSKLRVVFRPERLKPDYVLQGVSIGLFMLVQTDETSDWTYVLYPQLPLLLMPYPELIQLLKKGLDRVYHEGSKLEAEWTHSTTQKLQKASSRDLHMRDSRPEVCFITRYSPTLLIISRFTMLVKLMNMFHPRT
jgi:hypothetical protein